MSTFQIVQLIDNITNSYELYSNSVILFIGTINNVLLFLIFTKLRIFRGNQCAYYLKIGSITDMSVLLATLPSNVIGQILHANLTARSIVWCKLQLMWSYSCGFYSLYIICFLAFDQYLSTNHRQSWRQKSTIKLAHCLIFLNLTFALFHGTLFLIFGENGIAGCTIYNSIASRYFTFFYYPLLSGVFPLIISGVFSLLAYRNVRRIVRRQVPIVRRRLDRQMTAMALARVLCIIILGVPFLCYSLIQVNTIYSIRDSVGRSVLKLSSVITFSLLYANYAISFYVFLFISPRYRSQVKHFLVKKCWRQLTQLCSDRLTVPMNNRIVPDVELNDASVVESI